MVGQCQAIRHVLGARIFPHKITHMPSSHCIVRQAEDSLASVTWQSDSPIAGTFSTRKGDVVVAHGRFVGGAADGVEVVRIDTGASITWILPTRGCSIWRIQAGSLSLGWRSPIAGPVHPDRVPIHAADGLGWLEGFDELLVRCGLESNGAPEFAPDGKLLHPLHGRIGNLAAQGLSLEVDVASGRVELSATTIESKLFFKRLRLLSRLRFTAGSADVDILDDVTNDLSQPATMQLLYHINVGAPLLGDGSKVSAAVDTLAPKDSHSAAQIDRWDTYEGPTAGDAERVYYARARAGDSGRSLAMIQSPDADQGMAVSFNTKHLPRFIVWKNTAAESDGYVTGLEPATNYPNERGYEASQGRVIELDAGETKSFRLTIRPLVDAPQVAATASEIESIMGDVPAVIETVPKPGWTPNA